LGKVITLNGEKYTIIGVASAAIPAPSGWLDMYLAMDMSPKGMGARAERKFEVLGRLKPGISLEQARAEFQTIMSRLAQQYPESDKDLGGFMITLHDLVAGDPRVEMYTLLTIVGLVLLIACANVTNLSLVRASERQQEMAVRNALGAGRSRLIRQMLTESVLLALAGTALAWPLGWAGVRVLTLDRAMHFPVVNVIDLNPHVLAFTLGVGLLVGILVGLAPALQASSLHVNEELKSGAQAVVGSPRGWRLLRDALVVGEIAIVIALLVAAGLMLRSFAKLREIELGIHPEGVLTANVSLPPNKYSTVTQKRVFFDQVLQNVQGAHGVQGAAVAVAVPLEGGMFEAIRVPGYKDSAPRHNFAAGNAVTPEYFQTLGIPFLRGRNFTPQDIEGVTESVEKGPEKPVALTAIINQKMARQYWPDQDPIGRIFSIDGKDQATVIGVVGDTVVFPGAPPLPQTYYPLPVGLRLPETTLSIMVKGAADDSSLAPTLFQQFHALDDGLALYKVRTMRQVLADSMSWESSQSLLLTTFALLALVLTAVGIYSVMAYAVTQRTHELGLRMALGARSREIMRLVMRQGTRIMIIGVVLGVAGALALSRLMANFVFGVQPRDPVTFVFVAAFVALIALLASFIPARRATKVNPMVALRHE
jgi:putative ABC transport system permease protein